MNELRVTFLGSGDAFGSGGRLQPCVLVESQECCFFIDCGATVMTSIRRYKTDPNQIDLILLSHLHGDHFGGIPFFILDAQLISKRTKPLIIAGPIGTESKIFSLMETMFPGSSMVQRKFSIEFVSLTPGQQVTLSSIKITPYRVEHMTASDALALRIECDDQIIAYTGDTEWTETMLPACFGADLVIAEAYYFDKKVKYHMDLKTLLSHWPELQAKRLVCTHMSDDILARTGELVGEFAADGKIIELSKTKQCKIQGRCLVERE